MPRFSWQCNRKHSVFRSNLKHLWYFTTTFFNERSTGAIRNFVGEIDVEIRGVDGLGGPRAGPRNLGVCNGPGPNEAGPDRAVR